ncbi:MAG: Gfo/Idh/MocA family oxidoreductase [Micrococcales bacterium]|nr:Gfo/Idh/MocA family oxidoreductase [Micrococcales bacterium]
MERVRWGIIGVGAVTEVKSGPGFQQAQRSELVAVMRRDGDRARDYARRHDVPRWYDDADALIHDPGVDAVYVATPPDSHAHYAIRVLEASKPVYVEKPMARTASECEAMLAASTRAGRPLFVAYYRRAMPRFVTVRELVEGGAIGTVHAVSIRNLRRPGAGEAGATSEASGQVWRVNPQVSGGGHFVDLASHTLDLLDHLLGPVAHATGAATNRAGRYAAEDLVTASFTFESGVLGNGLWCYDAGEEVEVVDLVGSEGTLSFSIFGGEPLRLRTPRGDREIEAPKPATVQLPLIQSVVDELTGQGSCPSTGTSAIRTTRVIDAVLADYRTGRSPRRIIASSG